MVFFLINYSIFTTSINLYFFNIENFQRFIWIQFNKKNLCYHWYFWWGTHWTQEDIGTIDPCCFEPRIKIRCTYLFSTSQNGLAKRCGYQAFKYDWGKVQNSGKSRVGLSYYPSFYQRVFPTVCNAICPGYFGERIKDKENRDRIWS